MRMANLVPSTDILLIEPDGLVRSTVASVCHELELARVHQAASLTLGEQLLTSLRVEGLLLSLHEGEAALALLGRLREGAYPCAARIPVAVMSATCDAALLARLKELEVRRFLLQPFKLRDMVHTIEQLWPLRLPQTA